MVSAKQAAARQASNNPISEGCLLAPSREVFEFFNDNLSVLLKGNLSSAEDVQVHANRFDTRRGNSRCEDVFAYGASTGPNSRPTHGTECRAAWLPSKHMCEVPGQGVKSADVCGHLIGLDHVLRILVGWITPFADLYVHFAMIEIRSCVIPGEHAEDSRRLEVRGIPHDEGIRSIS